jgi:hypothetical protein
MAAVETRRELLLWLSGSMSDDEELTGLWAFLRDDLAYAPTNRSIIGAVLREHEFSSWRDLMLEIQQPAASSRNYNVERVRELASKLLVEMRAF